MLISTAYAQAGAAPTGAGLMAWLPLVLVLVVFYFLVLRPQSQRAKQHTQMLTTLRRGDTVLTAGGFHAKIHKVVDEATLEIELAGGVVTMFDKASVVRVLTRATEAKTEKPKAKAGKKAKK
jgi:preprotein translocase subunit YajC